jgi:hypothetical protein
LVGVLTDQFFAEHPVDEIFQLSRAAGPGEQGHSLRAVVGTDPQDRAGRVRGAAAQPGSPAEPGVGRRELYSVGLDVSDLHEFFSSVEVGENW